MGKKHREGFTLIELLVLMMVLAVALGFGVPAFTGMLANNRMSEAANDLVTSLHAARSEALTRSRSVTLCASSSWSAERPACDPGANLLSGWIVFVDSDTDATVADGEAVLQAHGPVDADILGQPESRADHDPPHYISFRADGFPQDVPGLATGLSNIQLCDSRGDVETSGERAAGRWIALSAAGRPALIDKVDMLQGDNNPLGGCVQP
jgi:type IV fimbrial biogenesis protein FimT